MKRNSEFVDMPMPILTSRLLIRPRVEADAPAVHQAILASYDTLNPWMPWAQTVPDLETVRQSCKTAEKNIENRSDITFSIFDVTGCNFIGAIGFQEPNWEIPAFNLAYWVNKKFQGQGYIEEAVRSMTKYAFEVLNARRVEIHSDSRNIRSLKLAQRLGFVQEGVLRHHSRLNDGTVGDTIVLARYDAVGI